MRTMVEPKRTKVADLGQRILAWRLARGDLDYERHLGGQNGESMISWCLFAADNARECLWESSSQRDLYTACTSLQCLRERSFGRWNLRGLAMLGGVGRPLRGLPIASILMLVCLRDDGNGRARKTN